MKRKSRSVKRTTSRRTSRRTTSRSSEHVLLLPFSFRRIVFITTALALFVGVVAIVNRHQLTQSVAGIQIMAGLFAQARVDLPKIDGAVFYDIYYKQQGAGSYTNVARNIPANVQSYTISYLKKGEQYDYQIKAVNGNGAEFWSSDNAVLTNIEPM